MTARPSDARGLERYLGLFGATTLLVGGVVGSGIFFVPGEMLASAPSVPACMAVWVGGGALCFMGSLMFAELGSMLPEAGGEYVYLREAFGRAVAFTYGWVLFAVIQSGSIAAVAVAFGEYATRLSGAADARLWGAAAIALTGLINMRTSRVAADLQAAVTSAKCLALVGLVVCAFCVPARDSGSLLATLPGKHVSVAGIGMALLAALWTYDGWNAVSLVAGEVEDPVRILPRALIGGLGFVVVLYIATFAAYVVCLGPAMVATSHQVAADVGLRALGAPGERLMGGLIALSTLGTVLGMMLTCPRTYYAMALDGLFLPAAARVHARWGTPLVAVALQAFWSLALLAWGTFDTLLSYVMFASWLFYGLTASSLLALRRRRGPGPFRTPGYPATPLIFLCASFALMLATYASDPRAAGMGATMMIAGLPLYALCRRAAGPPEVAA